MIVDLHAHYSMHLLAGEPDTVGLMIHGKRRSIADRVRTLVLRAANWIANYPGKGDKPAVTVPSLSQSNVRVALSVLFAPFDEIDLEESYGAPPRARYFNDLLRQIEIVEQEVAQQPDLALVARTYSEIAAAHAAGKVALVHAIEGGFHVGHNDETIRQNVQALKARGVAYVTVAHLFWRQVATNAPAIPFLPDALYAALFKEPDVGLSPLGESLITAMVENHILVDVTHMSAAAIDATLHLLDRLDPDGTVPVVATHSACKTIARARYNLSDEHIKAIARRDGVVGLIACRHWMAKGLPKPKSFADTMNLICKHIDHIHEVVGDPPGIHRFVAFGSDQDGFIKPALPGFDTPAGFVQVEEQLKRRYGPTAAANICSGNALRVLQWW